MKYLFIYDNDVEEFETKEEAIERADAVWSRASEGDKKSCTECYILESVNPDEDADDHWDGDYVKVYK